MPFRTYNTLGGQIEEFKPLHGNKVGVYTCGPTVYDFAHIGNYRTFVFQDILRRFLQYRGYEVRMVINLTDVDDKTIRNSKAAGLPLREYTNRYVEAYKTDRELLGLEPPEVFARATDHIDDIVKLVQVLEQKGYAYRNEGSVYFSVDKFKDYGKLSKIDFAGIRDGARVDSDEYDKENVRDFVLWKAAKEGEPFWDTPLGPGRPGWHIECSAMAMKYLGETFDIHSGGSDLIFPHHENEIAQSEAATGKLFARCWMHAEHLLVDGEKMSKSLGNFYTLRDLIAKGYKPSAVRYLLACVPYRRHLNFTFDGLHQAQQSIERLRNFRFRVAKEQFPAGANPVLQERARGALRAFEDAMDDNLNTAEALGAIFEMVRDGNTAMDRGEFRDGDRTAFLDTLDHWDRIFGVLEDNDHEKLVKFGLITPHERDAVVPAGQAVAGKLPADSLSEDEIARQVAERNEMRRKGDYARGDEIRQNLLAAGVILEDSKSGTRWKRK